MIKIVPYNSFLGIEGPTTEHIKFASGGLRGHDFAEFVKRAPHPLAAWVRDHPPLPGEAYVHNIALGSEEKYGCNRNYDSYPSAMLQADSPTFEKYARWYRLHKNTNPDKSYGVIKKAWFNKDLDRVETIAALNMTKEAAERNKGLIADKEMDTLESGRDLAVSQSVRVPYDECVSCGKKSKNRGEYCTHGTCKYGGCRENLGRTFEDGFQLFVRNPKGVFFDLSNVSQDLGSRGADRTAFVTGKVAANDERLPGGAELAEMLNLVPPDYLLDPHTVKAAEMLRKLASVKVNGDPAHSWFDCVNVRTKLANVQENVNVPKDDFARHQLLADMAADGVVLPPARWLSFTTGVDAVKCAGVFATGISPERHLLNRSDMIDLLAEVGFGETNRTTRQGCYSWLSPTTTALAKESALASFQPHVKVAASVPDVVSSELKARYLAYQASVLSLHPTNDVLLAECARHNTGVTV